MQRQSLVFFFFQAEDGIRDYKVTGVQTCALPISYRVDKAGIIHCTIGKATFEVSALKENLHALIADLHKAKPARSEEHTSELQSPCNLVCRLLLEKKKKKKHTPHCII